jgi:transposase-like protein
VNENQLPESLLEAVIYFADLDRCHEFVVSMRWPDGVIICPHCKSNEVGAFVKSRRVWNCKNCRKQFSVKTQTIFEDSPLSLSKWLPAVWLIVNAKNGISSCELARALKITQKSAWHMGHRIRTAIQRGGGIVRADGVVEVDESYIGGAARNMHSDKRREKITARGPAGKTAVMGLLSRHGENDWVSQVVAHVVPGTKRKDLVKHIRAHVPAGAEIHSDTHPTYGKLHEEYEHKVVDHAETYVKDGVHTNGLENFWCLLKRSIKGTYVHCSPFHLFRYLDEQTFRFNERKDEDGDLGRFVSVMGTVKDRRFTYRKLTGKKAVPKKKS